MLIQHIDFEVPNFGEFASAAPGADLIQTADAAFVDRGAVGLRIRAVSDSAGFLTTRPFAPRASIYVGFWLRVDPAIWPAEEAAFYLFNTLDMSDMPSIILYGYERTAYLVCFAGSAWLNMVPLPASDRWIYVIIGWQDLGCQMRVCCWLDGELVRESTRPWPLDYSVEGPLVVGPGAGWIYIPEDVELIAHLDEIKFGDSYADVQPTQTPPAADWPCPQRTLIVTRADDPDSESWGEYYRARRRIPHANWCRLPCSDVENLPDYAAFQSEVETPLADWLALNTAVAAQITTIVLGYGVPGSFVGDDGERHSAAARLARLGAAPAKTANPLYDRRAVNPRRITADVLAAARASSGLRFLVHRIDAPDLATAKALVDRAIALEGATLSADGWLDTVMMQGYMPPAPWENTYSDLLRAWGDSVTCQRLKQPVRRPAVEEDVELPFEQIYSDDWFFGWHPEAGDPTLFGPRGGGLRAIFYNADGLGCQTLRSDEGNRWCPLAIAAGYALTAGASMSTGQAATESLLSPWPLFECFRAGYTFAEAFAQANPFLDWTMTPVGDPLATVRFPAAGFHLYRGRPAAWPDGAVDLASIDYGTIVAAAPAGATGLATPVGGPTWPGGSTWPIALRAVDEAGNEFSDPLNIRRIQIDPAGRLAPPLGEVRGLTVQPTDGQRLRVAWRHVVAADEQAAAGFQVFVGPLAGQAIGQLLAAGPAATVAAHDDPRALYEWTSAALAAGQAWRVAVRPAASDGEPGPAAVAVATIAANRAVAVGPPVLEVR